MGTVDYLTDLANALETFFRGLSECGLLTCYSVQLQVSSIDFVIQIKFHCLIQELMKSLQALQLKTNIPGHNNSQDIGVQTPSDFDSVFAEMKSRSQETEQLGSLVETCVFTKSVEDIDWSDGDTQNDKDNPRENLICSASNHNTTYVVERRDNDSSPHMIVSCHTATLASVAEHNLLSPPEIENPKVTESDSTLTIYTNDHLEHVADNNLDLNDDSNKNINLSKEPFIEIDNSHHLDSENDIIHDDEHKTLEAEMSPLILKTYDEDEVLGVENNLNVMHIIVSSENMDDKVVSAQKNGKDKRKLYKCKVCQKTFTSMQTLELHLNRKHSAREQCDMCSRNFSSIQSLQEHCKVDHGGMGCFNCLLCSRRFMTKLSYKRHMDTHVGKKEAVCDMCGKTFSRADYLSKHYMTHSGAKPLSCSKCPRKFISSSHLKNHEKTHTGEREHVCKLCPKSFSRADKLKEHTLRHLNIKRFQCSICERSYAEKRDLTKHLKTHDK